MTMSQKILAKHAGLPEVREGQLIRAKLDMVLANDITGPVAINEFNKAGFGGVFDKCKVSLVMDHFAPNKDIKAATQCKQCRDFAGKYGIVNFYDAGDMGVEHALLPEKGLIAPGELCIGADSHTCTYGALGAFSTGVGSTDMAAGMATGEAWFKVPAAIRFNLKGKLNKYVTGKDVILHIIGMIGVDGALYKSMEFGGEGLSNLTVEDRLCMANMAIEAGAKNGIFEVDRQTADFVKERTDREFEVFKADDDAVYSQVIDIDLSKIEQTVAFPHLPENTKTEKDWGEVKIDQAVIGSCTNGRISDMRQAAEVPKGKHGRTLHSYSRNSENLSAMYAGGLGGDIYQCGLRIFNAYLRPLPRRTYGNFGGRRKSGIYHKPQLRRQNGTCGQRGLSCKPLCCGSQCNQWKNFGL